MTRARLVAACSAAVFTATVLTAVTIGATTAPADGYEFRHEVTDDFDCDGVRDHYWSYFQATVGGADIAGEFTITYSRGSSRTYSQATAGIPGTPEEWDQFGETYTSYDKNGDGCSDIVVSAPTEAVGGAERAGMVWTIPGSPSGLDTSKTLAYHQDSPGVPGGAEHEDLFGDSLTAGRTSSGEAYLIVGAHWEGTTSADRDEGAIFYFRGGTWQMIHQATPGVHGAAGDWDAFGAVLASSDRYFVVGSPADKSGAPEAGFVNVFSHTLVNGRPKPIAGFGQNTAGISGSGEIFDLLGTSVSVVPYRPTPSSSIGALVIATATGETLDSHQDAGMVHLVYVSKSGSVDEIAAVHQNTPGIPGVPEENERFGEMTVAAIVGSATVGTPANTVWVAAFSERGSANWLERFEVMRVTRTPGDNDILLDWAGAGDPAEGLVGASGEYLYAGDPIDPYPDSWWFGIPWSNILEGTDLPLLYPPDGAAG